MIAAGDDPRPADKCRRAEPKIRRGTMSNGSEERYIVFGEGRGDQGGVAASSCI